MYYIHVSSDKVIIKYMDFVVHLIMDVVTEPRSGYVLKTGSG